MRKRYGFLLGLTIVLALLARAVYRTEGMVSAAENGGGGWVQTGPDGGTMFAITVDPTNPERLYARGYAGVYRSLDGGASWEMVLDSVTAFGQTPVVVDPTDSNHLLVENQANGGVWESTDAGVTWEQMNTIFETDGIAFDPEVNGRIWAITEDDLEGVYRTVNGGGNWESVPLPGQVSPDSLLAHPTISNKVYVAGSNGVVFVSTNGGDSWDEGGTFGSHELEAVGPISGTLYAISPAFSGGNGVMRSTDDGETWAPFNSGLPVSITSLTVDPNDPMRVYAAARNGDIYRTTADGTAWEATGANLPWGGSTVGGQLAASATQPTTIYFADDGVYASRDNGDTWEFRSNGLSSQYVPALAVDPDNSLRVFAAGRQNEIFSSEDGGVTWVKDILTPTLLIEVNSLAIAPDDSMVMYFGSQGDGVYRSNDGGATWQAAAEGLPMDGSSYLIIEDIDIAPNNPDHVLAAVDGGLIYRTTNGGAAWNLVYDTGFHPLWQVTFAPTDPMIAWAGTTIGLVKSTDGGATWAMPTVTGLPEESDVQMVAVDPTTSNRLYAGVQAEASVVYRSVDGGESWQPLDTGVAPFATITDIWIDPALPDTLLISVNIGLTPESGIYRSENGGDTWERDMEGFLYPRTLEIEGEGARLYATTHLGGVWRRGDVPTTAIFTFLPLVGNEAGAGD